jgi:hypothetical protein
MADPKRQLIRLIERAQIDDIVREGQRERELWRKAIYSHPSCNQARLEYDHLMFAS